MSKLLLTALLLSLSACASKPMLPVSVYMGDSKSAGIARKQSGTSLKCDDPRFDQYVCLLQFDFIQLAAKANQCAAE